MIQSMTGFGSAERGTFKVEVRSVNHRFMDISVRLPQNLIQHEVPLRNMIKERFSRGRFDVAVSVAGEGSHKVAIDHDLAREVHRALLALKEELSLAGPVSVDTLAGFRDLIMSEETEYDAEPLYSAFREALEKLGEMRRGEGEAIMLDMVSRLELLERMTGEVSQICPEAVHSCREKFMERLKDLFGDANYDENRLLQEAAVMAEKTDVSEEITRIRSHLTQIRKVLAEGDAKGRKIEFLLQELNREVNTIASKANDYRISSLAVEMKAELEKMREQAQNIQ